MVDNLFLELTIVLGLALVLGSFGSIIKQPLIVSFIAVGVLSGSYFLNIVTQSPTLDLLSQLGIALLLFVVGLKLDIHMLKNFGAVIIFTGLGQVVFTSIFGFLLCLVFGMDTINSIYVAVALTFSSTIIIVKLLSDKKELDSLHGRISVGFLIVQDLLVIIALIFLSSLNVETTSSIFVQIINIFLKGLILLVLIFVSMKYIFPKLLFKIAKSQELLVLFSITWAVMLSEFSIFLGFTHEIGAFLAGVSIASSNFKEAITGRLSSIRDFLLLFFFVKLGSSLDFALIGQNLTPSIVLSIFVLIGNPIIVMIIMGLMGYKKRTGFLTGLAVAQISEFSLVLGALGLSSGHLNSSSMAIITLVALITISLSTYLIIYSYPIYAFISPVLNIFEKKKASAEEKFVLKDVNKDFDIIVIGLGRFGSNILKNLYLSGQNILAIDFDPKIIGDLKKEGRDAFYGDLEDPDLIDHIPLKNLTWIVITIPQIEAVVSFINKLKDLEYKGKLAVTAQNIEQELLLKNAGVDLVFLPYSFAADLASGYLSGASGFLEKKIPWALGMKEFRVDHKSKLCGKKLSDINLRAKTGANIVAVTRGGETNFYLTGDFMLFPGDHVLLAGDERELEKAKDFFKNSYDKTIRQNKSNILVENIVIDENSTWIGQSIKNLNLRASFGLNLIAIKRGDKQIASPEPNFTLELNDTIYTIKNT